MKQPERQVFYNVANSLHQDIIKDIKKNNEFVLKKFLPESDNCHFVRYTFVFTAKKVSVVFDTKAQQLIVTGFADAISAIERIYNTVVSKRTTQNHIRQTTNNNNQHTNFSSQPQSLASNVNNQASKQATNQASKQASKQESNYLAENLTKNTENQATDYDIKPIGLASQDINYVNEKAEGASKIEYVLDAPKQRKSSKSKSKGVAKKLNNYASDEHAAEGVVEKYYVPYNFNDMQKSRIPASPALNSTLIGTTTKSNQVLLSSNSSTSGYLGRLNQQSPADFSHQSFATSSTSDDIKNTQSDKSSATPLQTKASQSQQSSAASLQTKASQNQQSSAASLQTKASQSQQSSAASLQTKASQSQQSSASPLQTKSTQSQQSSAASLQTKASQNQQSSAASLQTKASQNQQSSTRANRSKNSIAQQATATSESDVSSNQAAAKKRSKSALAKKQATDNQSTIQKSTEDNAKLQSSELIEYKDGYSVKKLNHDKVKQTIDEISKISKYKIQELSTVNSSSGDITTYSIESGNRQKVFLRNIIKKNMLQLQGKRSVLFSEIQVIISRAEQPKEKEKSPTKQNKNVYKEVKKALPYAFDFLSEQSKIDFTIGLIDINSEEVRLSDYSVLLVPPYRGLERLLFDLQKAKNIEVKMIGQAYEKDCGNYTLKAGYRKKIDSIVYNEVMSALYTEYFEKRNFYAHSNNTDEVSERVISDKSQAKAIFDNLIKLINYNCKKLKETNFTTKRPQST